MTYLLGTLLGLFACSEKTQDSSTDPSDTGVNATDSDGDGFDASIDCDDTDPAIYPSAVQEASDDQCMIDADGDGYGDAAATDPFDPGQDCNDSDANTFPGAALRELDPIGCYTDADGDDYGASTPAAGALSGSDAWDDDASRWLLPAEGQWTYGESYNLVNDCPIDESSGDLPTEPAGFGLVNTGDGAFQMNLNNNEGTLSCSYTGTNFSCTINDAQESINPGIDIDIGISTDMTGSFSLSTVFQSHFDITIRCLDADIPIVGCDGISDLPCSIRWDVDATRD